MRLLKGRGGFLMKICRCGSIMYSGTHFENGQHNRYTECLKCHVRINGKMENKYDDSFRDILLKASR
jgi:hypothetical protein